MSNQKILKNNTSSVIFLINLGLEIPANNQIIIELTDYMRLSSVDTITELTPYVNSGDIIVNDGVNDLSPASGLNFLQWPDDAQNIRFKSNPERANGFLSKNTQDAIEEAKFGGHQFNEINCGEFLTARLLYAHNSTGGQVVSSSPTTISIDTQAPVSDTNQYLIASGEIEILYSDKCDIIYSITLENNSSTRTNTKTVLEINKGSGFEKILGSEIFTYERTQNADKQTGTKRVLVDVNKGDIIRIRAQINEGSNNIVLAEGCSISIIPRTPQSNEPNLTVDGSDVAQDEILGELDAGEL